MSEVIEETKKDVYLNNNDMEAVKKYFAFFKLPMPPEFEAGLEQFSKESNFANQKMIEVKILGSFLESKGNNEQLDKILEPLYELVQDAHYKLSWTEEFESAVTSAGNDVTTERVNETMQKVRNDIEGETE